MCNFGNIVVGATKKKAFQMSNASHTGPMSWVTDKGALASCGFVVEPDKIQKLPEGESVDVLVRFTAKGVAAKVGPKKAILPVQVKNAPTVQIILQANVCLPEIQMSSTVISFGSVYLGQSRRILVSFHNVSPVTAQWSFKRPIDAHEESKIVFTPTSGSLRAGKKVRNIQ